MPGENKIQKYVKELEFLVLVTIELYVLYIYTKHLGDPVS